MVQFKDLVANLTGALLLVKVYVCLQRANEWIRVVDFDTTSAHSKPIIIYVNEHQFLLLFSFEVLYSLLQSCNCGLLHQTRANVSRDWILKSVMSRAKPKRELSSQHPEALVMAPVEVRTGDTPHALYLTVLPVWPLRRALNC